MLEQSGELHKREEWIIIIIIIIYIPKRSIARIEGKFVAWFKVERSNVAAKHNLCYI